MLVLSLKHVIEIFLGDNQAKLLITNEKHKEEDLDNADASLGKLFCKAHIEHKCTLHFYPKQSMTIDPKCKHRVHEENDLTASIRCEFKDMSKLKHVKNGSNKERTMKDCIEDITSGLEEKKEVNFSRDRSKKKSDRLTH